jgi:hypothetical protein
MVETKLKFKDFIVKEDKLYKSAEFMKRIYKLSVWWVKRYNIPCDNITFDYGYLENQKENKLVTIRLIFNI